MAQQQHAQGHGLYVSLHLMCWHASQTLSPSANAYRLAPALPNAACPCLHAVHVLPAAAGNESVCGHVLSWRNRQHSQAQAMCTKWVLSGVSCNSESDLPQRSVLAAKKQHRRPRSIWQPMFCSTLFSHEAHVRPARQYWLSCWLRKADAVDDQGGPAHSDPHIHFFHLPDVVCGVLDGQGGAVAALRDCAVLGTLLVLCHMDSRRTDVCQVVVHARDRRRVIRKKSRWGSAHDSPARRIFT
eukprot:353090-Chlamydomonas_euryale.AAC.5